MIPRTIFGPEHELFRESVRKFLETEAVPYHAEWEENGMIDRDFWRKAGKMGFLAPTVPEEYGGVGADFRYNVVVDEEVARLGLSGVAFCLHSDIVTPYIVNNGSEYQKEKYLPGCVSGDIVTAIAMSEPGTGSDLQSVKTTATRDGDEYVINGSKTFISNGQLADIVIVVAKTDPSAGAKGTSLFIVETDTPGFERGRNLKKIGLKAQDTSELFFNDVRVPKENLLGREGGGFYCLMEELPQERLSNSVTCVAMAQSILDHTVRYVQERKVFGKAIGEYQNTQFKLAELDTEITSMRVFLDRCIELLLEEQLDTITASKIKLLTAEVLCRVADECLQLHGGYGYMWDYPVARFYADARINRIYAGTSEIMKMIISRGLVAS